MNNEINSTLIPYDTVERDDIQYTYCHDYDHISRYKNLRQVIHQGLSPERYIALETINAISSQADLVHYVVPSSYENRLDLIARDMLGSATYAWIIAYFNDIEDGFTVPTGRTLSIPKSVSSLFENGECLSPVSAIKMNLGSE